MLECGLLYVLRAEQKTLSKRRRVYPFAFRLSASVCSGADSVCLGTWEGRMSVVLSGARYVSPALGRAVLIEYDRAGALSMAMMGTRRRCSWPSRVGCASARKLFFSRARRGWGSERGRGLAVRAVSLLLRRKNGILILGRG